MKALRTPVGVWTQHRAVPVLLLLLAGLLAWLSLGPGPGGGLAGDLTDPATGARGLLAGTATLAAAALLHLTRRIAASGPAAWPVVLAAVAAPELAVGTWSLTHTDTVEPPSGWAVALGPSLLCAALLVGLAERALHHAIEEDKREVEELHQRLRAVEDGLREDRGRLHEINATIAGIASAQKLMHAGLPGDRSEALAAMMHAEVERLQRLVADRGPARRRSIDLDEVVGQIVLSHLSRGRIVLWEPTGLQALGRADDIAEVVNVLLENAAVHGGPDAVTVRVTPEPATQGVTITVADQGPGIDVALRDRVFDWGVGRPDSPGQGIGLHVAADLSHRLGGRLELLPTGTGATFALHLPAATQEVGPDEHVARAS